VASLLQLLGTRDCKQVKTKRFLESSMVLVYFRGQCFSSFPTIVTLKEAGSFEIPALWITYMNGKLRSGG